MNREPDFYVVAVTDGEGFTHRRVCNDTCDTICVEGVLPAEHPDNPGERFYFESEAYHLKKWAEENGMVSFEHGFDWGALGYS